MSKILLRLWKFMIFFVGTVILVILGSRYFVEQKGSEGIRELDEIPKEYSTALILGTNTRLANGRRNAFHYYRVEAIIDLFENGKIQNVLVSGDNGRVEYNEPEAIQADLVEYGIPADIIELDYAGFRTLDSIVRSRTAFNEDKIIIVSQEFHIERALTIANHFDIDAIGYVAKDVSIDVAPRVYIREVLARVKMMLDLFFLQTQPKFLQ